TAVGLIGVAVSLSEKTARPYCEVATHGICERAALPPDPWPDERTGSCLARDRSADDRSSGAGVRATRQGRPFRIEEGLSHLAPGGDLPCLGHRCVGSRARQHAVAKRSRVDVRDGPFRGALA